jgi:hypothetical protein
MMPLLSMSAIISACACTLSYAATSPLQVGLVPGHCLFRGCVQMVFHHLIHLGERPVPRICAVEEDRDVVRIRVPGLERRLERGLVVRLQSGQDVGRPCDVLLQ